MYISSSVQLSICQKNPEALKQTFCYIENAQVEIGLEWLARHSLRIAQHMLYLRICQDNVIACITLNEAILDYLANSMYVDYQYMCLDESVVEVETVKALNALLSQDPYSEQFIIDRLVVQIQSELAQPAAAYLLPLNCF
jgi:hypothetical protein